MIPEYKNYRYSFSFKQKVVGEIEKGKYNIQQASSVYDISKTTIYVWINKFGKRDLINGAVRIQMKNEVDRIKLLEKEKQKLESALAQAHLKIMALESTIEVADEIYQTDLKKKFGLKVSSSASKK